MPAHPCLSALRRLGCGALLALLSSVAFAQTAQATQAAQAAQGTRTEPALGRADEALPLPGGQWLVQDGKRLQLLDSRGAPRASLPLRAKYLDLRTAAIAASDKAATSARVLLLDSDTQSVRTVAVDLASGRLTLQPPLAATSFSVEALCLYRDAQGLDHAFVIGKDGITEQWLIDGPTPRLLRRLSLPAGSDHCRVDDSSHTLFVSESGLGLWAYAADSEGIPARVPVVLRQPWGPLQGGAGGLSVVPGGVAVLDAQGSAAHLLVPVAGGWQPRRTLKLPRASAEHLGWLPGSAAGAGRIELLTRDSVSGSWAASAVAWQRPAVHSDGALPMAVVMPRGQTAPVERFGDAADDPAIWLHPSDGSASRVLGTNKKQGLLVYDLQGKQLQLLESGRLNNVDVRQRVIFASGAAPLDLALASKRDDNSIAIFLIDERGQVSEAGSIGTALKEIYGMCLYQPRSGGLQVLVNDKNGAYAQYRVERNEQRFSGTLLRQFKVGSQPEGCVADDAQQRLFIGEEKRGVWVMAAEPQRGSAMQLILGVGKKAGAGAGAILKADVEGLALYHGSERSYLLVSSQGNDSYVVLDAAPPYAVRGRFRIGINLAEGIDAASETDGLEVSSANFGGVYAQGLLVVQDGFKRMPDAPQNFKLVAWSDIAKALGLR